MGANPLEGIRVIELCAWHTGPMVACILADQGADVIKVEPPGAGDPYRYTGTSRGGQGAPYMAANRNKRSIALDLKKPDHLDALMVLIENADVFIQNMKPGVMDRLGLNAQTLRNKFPRLIYASISGYGQTGPNAKEGAFDTMLQACSGLMYIQSDQEGGVPKMIKTVLPDKITSPIVAQAICAALFARERSGEGCLLEYAMLDGTIWWIWPDGMMNNTFIGEKDVSIGIDFSEVDLVSKTLDGYLVATAHMDKQWAAFVELIGRPELHDDPKVNTARARGINLGYYSSILRNSFGDKTTEEWCRLLRERDIPCAPVLKPEEVAQNPQVVWNKLIEEVEHPQAGRHLSVRNPVLINGEANNVFRPSPAVGADTQDIIKEFGLALDLE